MSKNIIVTGVTGMDGSNMVDYLLKNTDYRIYGMVRRTSTPNHENIKGALKNERFSIFCGDLSDPHSIEKAVRELRPAYFINFAAQSFVGSSWDIPAQTFEVGALALIHILEAVRKHCPSCRTYNAGSSEEWGAVEYEPQDENHPMRPQSPYGAAKCAARHIVRVYRQSYNLYAIQGTLLNHEGIRRGEEFVTRKITKEVARIKKSIDSSAPFAPMQIGNIRAKRDWSDSEDFVDGVWRMLNQEVWNGADPHDASTLKEYVLSSNETHTVREFIERAFGVAGIDGLWVGESLLETYIRSDTGEALVIINPEFYRPAEVETLYGNSDLARRELQWSPKINFEELVRRMVENDLNQQGGQL